MIAVASGKGGVGKSSLTVNLAAALDALGQQVGVLDADIYGHSIPHMLGIHQRPIVVDKMIVPPVRGDLKLISIGFFLDDNAPVMWRGPMLHRALEQFLSDVHWGELDTLVVDMPPGTGDVAISLGQLLPRAEVARRDDAAAARAGGRVARGGDGAEDRHAAARRRREHERATPSATRRRRAALADELGVPLLGASRSTPRCARRATRACPSSRPTPTPSRLAAIVAIAEALLRHAAGRDPQAADRLVLRRRRGARRRPPHSSSLVELVALVDLREHPDAGDLDAGHLDLVARLDAVRPDPRS